MSRSHSLRHLLIGDKNFYMRVITILMPIIIQNTVTNVVSLIDNVMVGSVGTLQMSAVAIVNQLLFVFNLCIFGGLAGAGIFAAQYAGAKDTDGVRHCFRMKVYIALSMTVLALAVFYFMPGPLISMYLTDGTNPADTAATLGFGLEYMEIMLIGLVPFAVSQIYGSTLRELGETKLPMIASVAAICINLVFNYIFIFGNEGLSFLWFGPMGVAGAAIATVMSRFAEAVIIVVFVHIRSDRFEFIRHIYRSLKIPMELCISILKKGLPLLFNEFMWSFGMAVLLQCYSVRGLDVVAASNISSTVNNLFNVVFLSMGNAIAIMAGQHLGANEPEEAKTTVWRLLVLSLATCLVMGTLMVLIAPLVPNIYNTTDEVRRMATDFLYVVALMMPFYAFAHGCYFTLRSGGKTLITMFFDCGYTWCLSIPLAFFLANYTGMPILPLYICIQLLDVIKCVIGFILVKKGVWINNIVNE